MSVWIYPGSFDPITLGHENIIARGAKLCDTLYVAVLENHSKHPTFTTDEKIELIKECTSHMPNVVVECFSGLLADYAKQKDADAILRGIRNTGDYEYEHNMSQLNKKLNSNIETVFVCAEPELACISSSSVKEIAKLGGDFSWMVNKNIYNKLKDYINRRK
ncbi:MAG: pantetheine-phosphate adenylyltransferase [Clostridia bacterium]|nr:pantetheine-phosphate adenylyltransferase [Clostridia bacterium]